MQPLNARWNGGDELLWPSRRASTVGCGINPSFLGPSISYRDFSNGCACCEDKDTGTSDLIVELAKDVHLVHYRYVMARGTTVPTNPKKP